MCFCWVLSSLGIHTVVLLTAANILAVSDAVALDGSAPRWSGGTVKCVYARLIWLLVAERVTGCLFAAGLNPFGAPSSLARLTTVTSPI